MSRFRRKFKKVFRGRKPKRLRKYGIGRGGTIL